MKNMQYHYGIVEGFRWRDYFFWGFSEILPTLICRPVFVGADENFDKYSFRISTRHRLSSQYNLTGKLSFVPGEENIHIIPPYSQTFPIQHSMLDAPMADSMFFFYFRLGQINLTLRRHALHPCFNSFAEFV